jgi:hypothetical protein
MERGDASRGPTAGRSCLRRQEQVTRGAAAGWRGRCGLGGRDRRR